jgi:hypothetical protein
MKRVFFSFLFVSFLSASMLYKNKNICIDDFYYKNGNFFYKKSSDGNWYSTWNSNNIVEYGYFYNDDNETCEYNLTLKQLKVSYFDYYFLWGLSGVLMGFLVLFGFIYSLL